MESGLMLTDAKVKTLKPKDKLYRILDTQRLYIEVRPTGTKIWRYKFVLNGKEGTVSFGEYPAVSLQDARKLRDEAQAKLAKGLAPGGSSAIKMPCRWINNHCNIAI